jgi:hypothetical protein
MNKLGSQVLFTFILIYALINNPFKKNILYSLLDVLSFDSYFLPFILFILRKNKILLLILINFHKIVIIVL